MECRGVSQIAEAKCFFRAFADSDTNDPTKSFVFELVCLSQAGRLEVANQAEPFCLEVKDLSVSLEGCICGTCQVTSTAARCVTSVNNSILTQYRQHLYLQRCRSI